MTPARPEAVARVLRDASVEAMRAHFHADIRVPRWEELTPQARTSFLAQAARLMAAFHIFERTK
jgi:hypothetical protein